MWHCDICYRAFNTKHALEQHLNSGIHEGDLYQCKGCSRTFRTMGSLNQHVSMTECSARTARQMRTLVKDASDAKGLLQLTDQSHLRRSAAPEGTSLARGPCSH